MRCWDKCGGGRAGEVWFPAPISGVTISVDSAIVSDKEKKFLFEE